MPGLPSKFPYRKAAAGDRLCLLGPCGGGYGHPLKRSDEAILADIEGDLLSESTARRDYSFTMTG